MSLQVDREIKETQNYSFTESMRQRTFFSVHRTRKIYNFRDIIFFSLDGAKKSRPVFISISFSLFSPSEGKMIKKDSRCAGLPPDRSHVNSTFVRAVFSEKIELNCPSSRNSKNNSPADVFIGFLASREICTNTVSQLTYIRKEIRIP